MKRAENRPDIRAIHGWQRAGGSVAATRKDWARRREPRSNLISLDVLKHQALSTTGSEAIGPAQCGYVTADWERGGVRVLPRGLSQPSRSHHTPPHPRLAAVLLCHRVTWASLSRCSSSMATKDPPPTIIALPPRHAVVQSIFESILRPKPLWPVQIVFATNQARPA